jgi:uncharacterized surface protein with fasciclin (FAS1) repeats
MSSFVSPAACVDEEIKIIQTTGIPGIIREITIKDRVCDTILGHLVRNPHFSILCQYLQQPQFRMVLQQCNIFTLFAPTNEAFADMERKTCSTPFTVDTLLYHLLPEKLSCGNLCKTVLHGPEGGSKIPSGCGKVSGGQQIGQFTNCLLKNSVSRFTHQGEQIR